jgi:RES domain-containing protein
LKSFLGPFSGYGVRHIPAGSGRNPLDFRYSARAADNRWNTQGQPTFYLASEQDVAVAEFGRHLTVNRSASLGEQTRARQIYRIQVTLEHVIDLRQPGIWELLSLENAPFCFLKMEQARAVAQLVRAVTPAQAILAPSMAFLDKLDRWVMAIFLDKILGKNLDADPSIFFTEIAKDAVFDLRANPESSAS